MKKLIMIVILSILCLTVCRSYEIAEPDTKTSLKSKNRKIDLQKFTWASTSFISLGYGYPEGYRGELGITASKYFTAGLSLGIADYWSNNPTKTSSAVFLRASIPLPKSSMGLYISTATGLNLDHDEDEFLYINLGLLIPIVKGITLRPEIGYAWTSRFKSWKWISNFWGTCSYKEYERRKFTSFNLIFEFDMRPLLW